MSLYYLTNKERLNIMYKFRDNKKDMLYKYVKNIIHKINLINLMLERQEKSKDIDDRSLDYPYNL